jgi:formylglycine-generating enzyme required for sulfatase activity
VTRDQFAAFVNVSGYKAEDHCFTFEQNAPQDRANRSFMNPGYVQDGNHPAVCVSWADAKAYVAWLSQTTGKSYRLLSEAEFEYAARAGTTSRFGFGNDPAEICKFANGADQAAKIAGLPGDAPYMGCRDGFPFTAPVGSLTPNAFGLYDLIGNVWEWTEDCYYGDYATAKADSAAHSSATCSTRTCAAETGSAPKRRCVQPFAPKPMPMRVMTTSASASRERFRPKRAMATGRHRALDQIRPSI